MISAVGPVEISGMKRLTVAQIAKEFGVNVTKVLAWINGGELRAVNVASKGSKLPRYRIAEDDLAAFERLRESAHERLNRFLPQSVAGQRGMRTTRDTTRNEAGVIDTAAKESR